MHLFSQISIFKLNHPCTYHPQEQVLKCKSSLLIQHCQKRHTNMIWLQQIYNDSMGHISEALRFYKFLQRWMHISTQTSIFLIQLVISIRVPCPISIQWLNEWVPDQVGHFTCYRNTYKVSMTRNWHKLESKWLAWWKQMHLWSIPCSN